MTPHPLSGVGRDVPVSPQVTRAPGKTLQLAHHPHEADPNLCPSSHWVSRLHLTCKKGRQLGQYEIPDTGVYSVKCEQDCSHSHCTVVWLPAVQQVHLYGDHRTVQCSHARWTLPTGQCSLYGGRSSPAHHPHEADAHLVETPSGLHGCVRPTGTGGQHTVRISTAVSIPGTQLYWYCTA